VGFISIAKEEQKNRNPEIVFVKKQKPIAMVNRKGGVGKTINAISVVKRVHKLSQRSGRWRPIITVI
jgi:hypothetical protein